MENDNQISFYKKLKEKGDLAALYTDNQKFYEIYYYKKNVYEAIFSKDDNSLLMIKKFGDNRK
ncbi:MAG: hypothetical protein ABIL89_08020 [candidate division WOR-3 bacterium]